MVEEIMIVNIRDGNLIEFFALGQINSTGKTLLKKIFEKIMLKRKYILLKKYESFIPQGNLNKIEDYKLYISIFYISFKF
jgi:hypothetical protein